MTTPAYNNFITTPFAKNAKLNVLQNFLALLHSASWKEVVALAIEEASQYWKTPPDFENKVLDFLANKHRLEELKEKATFLLSI